MQHVNCTWTWNVGTHMGICGNSSLGWWTNIKNKFIWRPALRSTTLLGDVDFKWSPRDDA